MTVLARTRAASCVSRAALLALLALHGCNARRELPLRAESRPCPSCAPARDAGADAAAPEAGAVAPVDDDAGADPTDAGDAAAGPPLCTGPDAALREGPLLGAVSDRAIKVWSRGDRDAPFTVVYWPHADPGRVQRVEGAWSAERELSGVAALEGLSPSTRYRYRVERSGCALSAEHAFTTLPPQGSPARLRFVSAGDVSGGDIPGFDDIGAVEPAFVLMVGDNVYADGLGTNSNLYRERYLEVWQGEQFSRLFARVAAFAIWDDHELVDNYWEGKHDRVFGFASRLYDAFQGSRNPEPLGPGERYYAFHAADAAFFVLDTRTHRSPNADPDGAGKSMLGPEQKQALLDWLERDSSRVHVLVSSVLVSSFSTTGEDAWSSFATERAEIFDQIARAEPENLFVISGDQHWSAVIRMDLDGGYELYEFQATPLGFDERGAPTSTSDALLSLDNTHRVFAVYDLDTRVDPPTLHYTLCAVGLPCAVSEEAPPSEGPNGTLVPYTVRFAGGDLGLRLDEP